MAGIDLASVDNTEFDDEDYVNEVYKALEGFKAKYRQIAIYFGLSSDKVDEIENNHPRDSAGALNDVIVSWVRQEHNVAKFGYPCWRKVVEAAIGAENNLQAKKIAKSHPAGVRPVKKVKPADSSSPSQPIPPRKIIGFNVMDRKVMEIGGGDKRLNVEIYNPFMINRKNLQPIQFTFGLVNPKGGNKATAIDEYDMKAFPHGIALIINNVQFAKQSDRDGTIIDERNLIHAFRYLGYRVEVHRNLNSKEMLAIMSDMGARSHAKYDSFVCCILSHGKEGHVYGSDSAMVSLYDLFKKVDANHCNSLETKPKLFFVQACRGKMNEESFSIAENKQPQSFNPIRIADGEVTIDDDHAVPVLADFFIGYATPLGFVAWRDLNHGSWYIAELCRAICELSTHASLSDIMTSVCHKVRQGREHSEYKMSPERTNCLQKNVYF